MIFINHMITYLPVGTFIYLVLLRDYKLKDLPNTFFTCKKKLPTKQKIT